MTPEERRAGFERDRADRAASVEHDREVRAEGLEDDRERRAEGVEGARVDRAFVVRKKDRRFRWETRMLYVVAIGLAVYVAHLAGEIQQERIHNTTAACQRDSVKNAAIVGFVVDSIAANPRQRRRLTHPDDPLRSRPYAKDPELDAYIVRAIETFPTTSKAECARRAERQVRAG